MGRTARIPGALDGLRDHLAEANFDDAGLISFLDNRVCNYVIAAATAERQGVLAVLARLTGPSKVLPASYRPGTRTSADDRYSKLLEDLEALAGPKSRNLIHELDETVGERLVDAQDEGKRQALPDCRAMLKEALGMEVPPRTR